MPDVYFHIDELPGQCALVDTNGSDGEICSLLISCMRRDSEIAKFLVAAVTYYAAETGIDLSRLKPTIQ